MGNEMYSYNTLKKLFNRHEGKIIKYYKKLFNISTFLGCSREQKYRIRVDRDIFDDPFLPMADPIIYKPRAYISFPGEDLWIYTEKPIAMCKYWCLLIAVHNKINSEIYD